MASGNKNLKKILAENYFLACNQVELRCYVTCKSVSLFHVPTDQSSFEMERTEKEAHVEMLRNPHPFPHVLPATKTDCSGI